MVGLAAWPVVIGRGVGGWIIVGCGWGRTPRLRRGVVNVA